MIGIEEAVGLVRSADGTQISYRRAGKGPPLVLVHGIFDDARLWQVVSPVLEERFTVYAVDRRGRGNSGAHGDGYSVEREYEDVAAVVEAAASDGGPVHLLGHSSGARYALHAALLVPGLVRGLVLYEPPPFYVPPPEVMARFEGLAERGDRDGILAAFYEDLAGVPPAVVDGMRNTHGWQMEAENALTFVPEARSLAGYRFDPASLADLRIPALLLLGGESPPLFREQAVVVAAALPDARICTLPGQGHEAMLTAPELFAREVKGFLAQR